MLNKKTVLTMAKKEFFSFLNTPLAYVIIVPFLIISTFLYFRTALLTGEASLRPYFELLPYLMLFLAPALSMSLLSLEQEKGTLELLFAHPISEAEIVLGKFLGVLGFFTAILLTTLGLPITILIFSKPDLGIVFSQYLGAVFLGATFLSLGLLASAFVKNNIGSFLLAASLGFVLILIGLDLIVLGLPWPFSFIASQAGVLPHFSSIARGVLDIRDIIYFMSLTVIFLSLAIIKLSSRKTEEDKQQRVKLNTYLAVIIVIGIGFNILFQLYPLRIDLTKGKLFTLSKGTKQTLKNLEKDVDITVYASQGLPGNIQTMFKEVKDLLKDYDRYGTKLEVEYKHPDIEAEAAGEVKEEGIQEVTFNKIGASSFEVQKGYLGLVINVDDKKEVLPFIDNPSNLEYQLTRRIRKLTAEEQKVLGLVNNDFMNQYQILRQSLLTEYKIETVDLETPETATTSTALLVINTAESQEATAAANLKEYLKDNGKALVLTKGVIINPQALQVDKTESEILKVLKDYGININLDMVYDLQLNEAVTLSQGAVRYILPYPYWLKALPVENSLPVLSHIQSISLAWPSSLSLEEKDGVKIQKLLQTSVNAGIQDNNFTISPEEAELLPQPKKQNIPLAVLAEKDQIKLAVVSDYNLASDQFIQTNPQNLSFLVGIIDFLLQDEDVAAIPTKARARAVFNFTDQNQGVAVQYINLLGPSVLVIGFALYWLNKRKKLSLKKYRAD
jgi:ABC-type uncharacterized transport system involved in gliding motility auxiliary subunit/ABC-type transport system involved in multi-copper enzyme maturation permease subunit